VPWWNSAFQTHRKKLRRTFNRAKRTNDWETYRKALTDYNLELRRAKRTRETRLATWHTFWHAFSFANTRHATWLALICARLLPYGIDVGIIFSMPLYMTYGSHLA
jgi:hypothetical protein